MKFAMIKGSSNPNCLPNFSINLQKLSLLIKKNAFEKVNLKSFAQK
jgi:hypothetical protein